MLDDRREAAWTDDERAPELKAMIGQDSVWEHLAAATTPQPIASHASQITEEMWARLEAWLPYDMTHSLLITDADVERVPFPDLIEAEVKRDLALWRDTDGELPGDVVDVALLTPQPSPNTVRSLENTRREYRRNVVRQCAGNDVFAWEDIDWLARHLAGKKVGLTLGSGGARGFAHIGVVDELRRLGVPIDYIGGCSIGGCVGAGYATSLSSDTILHSLADFAHSAFRPTLPHHSLASNSGFVGVVQRLWGDFLIEDAMTPLAIIATDILTGIEVVLDHGLLWKAVTASASIPGVYPPIVSDGYCLVDDSVVFPMPVAATRQMGADVVIAVKLGGDIGREPRRVAMEARETLDSLPSQIDVIHRSFDLMSTEVYARQTVPGDVTIVVDVPGLHVREFVKGVSYIPAGTAAVTGMIPDLVIHLPWLRDGLPAPVE